MELFFSPLACSMAARIALYEAGAQASFTEVDPKTQLTLSGQPYRDMHPLGLVPALRTDEGLLLTENAAVLQYIADRYPAAELAPRDGFARAQLQQWLCFIATELHKVLFAPLLAAQSPDEVKAYALAKAPPRLAYLQTYLHDRQYLLDRFSVADAYLVTVLNWAMATRVDLKQWPAVVAYSTRLRERPSVARAFTEERALYVLAQQRHRVA